MTDQGRLAEIRARAERYEYSSREHYWAGFDADEDVLWLLAKIAELAQQVSALQTELRIAKAPERLFSIQRERGAAAHPLQIPWSVAQKAYSVYSAQYGMSQSLECLNERGGFHPSEMDVFLPGWREEVCEITALRQQVSALTQGAHDKTNENETLRASHPMGALEHGDPRENPNEKAPGA